MPNKDDDGRLFDAKFVEKSWMRTSGGFGSREMWDASAADYAVMEIPSFDKDPFLRMLAEEGALEKNMRVLDIGCGSGVYGLAMADYVCEVIGCDLSPKMVEAAEAKALEAGCKNIRFICGDFESIAFDGPFDLVFAHMTPAIGSGAAFRKMTSLSKKWCFLAMPVRRTDFMLQEARKRCGVPVAIDARDEAFLSAFSMVWLDGHTPTMRHHAEVWDTERPIDVAVELYCNKLIATDLSDEQKAIAAEYLLSAQKDGRVREHVETQIAMLGWRVDR